MLSISTPMKAAGRVKYYMGRAPEDYYLEGERQPGHWFGQARQPLGLPDQVQRRAFHHLLNGFSADGQRPLVQNAGDPKRASCWDLTFSAPKSVSVLWALAPESIRQQIEQVQQEAVEQALAHIEAVAGITRRGKGGVIREPGALVFATFFEGTSRALEPAIHTHAVLPNLALRRDGTTGTLLTRKLFEAKMETGALYRDVLAAGLQQKLRLGIEPDTVGFHLRGVPRILCDAFSTRRRTMLKAMRELGLQGAVAAKMVALLTRPKKAHCPLHQLFERWQEVGRQFGWGREEARRLLEQASQRRTDSQTQEAPRTSAEPRPPQEQFNRDRAHQPEPDSAAPVTDRAAADPQNRADSQPRHAQAESDAQRSRYEQSHSQRSGADDAQDSRSQERAGNRDRDTHADADVRQRAQEDDRGQRGDSGQEQAGRSQNGNRSDGGRRTKAARAEQGGPTAGGRKPDDPARQRFRFEWRRLFPKAPFWSLAQFVKVPWLAFPEAQSRWGEVRWSRGRRLGQLRVQQRRLFPDAPRWSPLHGLQLPALRVVPPAWMVPAKPLTRWWSMRYKKDLRWGELRVQDRHPFRHAPRWSPLRRVALPALRLTTKKSRWARRRYPASQRPMRMRQSP